MQQLEGDVSNPCLRVVRLSGELLEVPLTRHEANKIVSVRDLKRCLAKNDTMICRSCPDLGQDFGIVYSFTVRTLFLILVATLHVGYPVKNVKSTK
jgi:hypothetical protein